MHGGPSGEVREEGALPGGDGVEFEAVVVGDGVGEGPSEGPDIGDGIVVAWDVRDEVEGGGGVFDAFYCGLVAGFVEGEGFGELGLEVEVGEARGGADAVAYAVGAADGGVAGAVDGEWRLRTLGALGADFGDCGAEEVVVEGRNGAVRVQAPAGDVGDTELEVVPYLRRVLAELELDIPDAT